VRDRVVLRTCPDVVAHRVGSCKAVAAAPVRSCTRPRAYDVRMGGIENFAVFVAAGVALNLAPGPDTLYILARSGAGGTRAGIASALGIAGGSVLHTLAAALGLSAILASSALAFAVVKYVGAAYLVWLGVRLLLQKGSAPDAVALQGADVRAAFRQGLLTNVLNPKVALFFLAFLPQFVDPAAPDAMLGFLLLGLTFVATGLLWCLVLARLGGAIGAFLRRRPAFGTWLDRAAGAVFVGLGIKLAAQRA
jgi:threonine/homoserine/homoserine lactone efflux protein